MTENKSSHSESKNHYKLQHTHLTPSKVRPWPKGHIIIMAAVLKALILYFKPCRSLAVWLIQIWPCTSMWISSVAIQTYSTEDNTSVYNV